MKRKIYIAALLLSLSLAAYGQVYGPGRGAAPARAEKGFELFDAGRYRAAERMLERAARAEAGGQGKLSENQYLTVEYMLAECAGRLGEEGAMAKLQAFLERHPGSAYSNSAHFAIGNLLYQQEDYAGARTEYAEVDRFALKPSQQPEYSFKRGHAYFLSGYYDEASTWFRRVGQGNDYSPHAKYFIAYIDYAQGRYAEAKTGFTELMSEPAYAEAMPFYLLQIEFLEGNYDYVIREGEPLLKKSTGVREAEIARILAEAWFHRGDYFKTLEYMAFYRDKGGKMDRSEWYMEGFSQYMRGDADAAIIAFTRVVGPDDKLTQNAAYHLGGTLLRKGEKQRAMQAFSMASGAYFDEGIREDALFNYGKLQYELGGGVFNEAINILNRYIKEYPQSPRVNEAREYLISAYYNSRNYEAAYEAIKLVPDPDNNLRTAFQKIAYFRAMEYYNAGDLDIAYRLLGESMQNAFNPKYTALTQFWRAEILFRRGEYEQAIPLYRDYLKVSPPSEREHRMASYNLGYSYFNLERWPQALGWFERFIAAHKEPDTYRADALNRAGDIQSAIRAFDEAVESYDKAIAVGTEQKYYAAFRRAVILSLRDGNPVRKVEALMKIVDAGEGPYVGDAIYELGRTYIGMERFTDAASMFRRYVENYPGGDKYLSALSDLGLAYQNLYDNTSALKYYQMLVEKAPSSPEARDAMLALKSLYVDMNNVDGYFDFASRAGMVTDAAALSRDSLTFAAAEKVYLTAGNRNSAVASLKNYIDKYPTGAYRANALYYMADSYTADGRKDEAIATLKELSAMHANSFTVRGLERLASMSFERRQYDDAADAYLKITSAASNPETVANAWNGYFRSAKATGDRAKTEAAAELVLSSRGVPSNVVKEAKFARAADIAFKGRKAEALAIYRELSAESATAIGAESMYNVIQALYDEGDLAAAETMIMKFAQANTPQTYWLGRAFLVLGDIYVARGDAFQARATLQSIIDGYSPADDGVVAGARQRIEKMGPATR